MSEKRFKGIKVLGKKPNEIFIKDKEKDYYIRTEDEVVELLNELSDENNILNKNEDDLKECTIENIKLKEENEQLRENLHNCRLNKNIISEKLKLWQDVHKEYDIYSIKDFEELMRNDK